MPHKIFRQAGLPTVFFLGILLALRALTDSYFIEWSQSLFCRNRLRSRACPSLASGPDLSGLLRHRLCRNHLCERR